MVLTSRDMARVGIFTGLAIAAATLTRYGSPLVPFSLLPMVSVLCGALLGSRLGLLSMGLYVLMGLLGLPVFATEPYGGLAYIMKPTFGFILGFVACSWVTGITVEKMGKSGKRYVVASILGMVSLYSVGIPYLWLAMNVFLGKATTIGYAVKVGMLPFLIPDLVKGILGGQVSAMVSRRVDAPVSVECGTFPYGS